MCLVPLAVVVDFSRGYYISSIHSIFSRNIFSWQRKFQAWTECKPTPNILWVFNAIVFKYLSPFLQFWAEAFPLPVQYHANLCCLNFFGFVYSYDRMLHWIHPNAVHSESRDYWKPKIKRYNLKKRVAWIVKREDSVEFIHLIYTKAYLPGQRHMPMVVGWFRLFFNNQLQFVDVYL